ncbi:MAG: helix-turn-helix transcriptional regulator, partial [Cyclobacteriaceae bacterium]|nr:helix-turn-helix transcriptional regulator [Cyclobacteriaceae bacterium HetDA_MAG_MS6]
FVATKNHKPMAEGGPLTPLTFQCPSSVLTFSDALFRIYRNQSLPELTKIKLVEFLHLLTAARPEVMESLCRAQNQPRRNLKAFMLAHFNKPLSVENFADLTGRSVSTFHRDFKEQFEMTPKKWLIRKRLEFARQMLIAQEKKKVSEIAWNAGFEDVPHFVKTFTQHYHISPKQLAIKMRRGALI